MVIIAHNIGRNEKKIKEEIKGKCENHQQDFSDPSGISVI